MDCPYPCKSIKNLLPNTNQIRCYERQRFGENELHGEQHLLFS